MSQIPTLDLLHGWNPRSVQGGCACHAAVQLSRGLWQRHMCNLPRLTSSLEDARSLSTSQPFLLLLFFRNKSFDVLFFLFYVRCTWACLFSPHVRELGLLSNRGPRLLICGGSVSCCKAWAPGAWASVVMCPGLVAQGVWNLPRPGINLVSPALTGGFLSTRPQRSPTMSFSQTPSSLIKHLAYLQRFKMATHSCTIPGKVPWTEKPGSLQSMGSQRVRHYWATSLSKSHEQKSLEGYCPRGHKESDTTEQLSHTHTTRYTSHSIFTSSGSLESIFYEHLKGILKVCLNMPCD